MTGTPHVPLRKVRSTSRGDAQPTMNRCPSGAVSSRSARERFTDSRMPVSEPLVRRSPSAPRYPQKLLLRWGTLSISSVNHFRDCTESRVRPPLLFSSCEGVGHLTLGPTALSNGWPGDLLEMLDGSAHECTITLTPLGRKVACPFPNVRYRLGPKLKRPFPKAVLSYDQTRR